jgi:hypothetical protein
MDNIDDENDGDGAVLQSGVREVTGDDISKRKEVVSGEQGSVFRHPDSIFGRSDDSVKSSASISRGSESCQRPNPFSQRPDPLSQRPGPRSLFQRPGNIFRDPKALSLQQNAVVDQIDSVRASLNEPSLKVKTTLISSMSFTRSGHYEEAKECFREIIAEGYPEGNFYITLIDAQYIIDNLNDLGSVSESEWEYYSNAFHLNLKLMLDTVHKHADTDIIVRLTRILNEARGLDLELMEDAGKVSLVDDVPYVPEKCDFRGITTLMHLAAGGEPHEVGLLLSALEEFIQTDEFKKFEGTSGRK